MTMLLTLSVYQLTIRSELPNKSGSTPIIGQYNVYNYLPPTKEEVLFSPARPRSFVCLSVCLSVYKITQKGVHGFG